MNPDSLPLSFDEHKSNEFDLSNLLVSINHKKPEKMEKQLSFEEFMLGEL
jgi:hypothetical protein